MYQGKEIEKGIDDRANNDIGGLFCYAHCCGVECEPDGVGE